MFKFTVKAEKGERPLNIAKEGIFKYRESLKSLLGTRQKPKLSKLDKSGPYIAETDLPKNWYEFKKYIRVEGEEDDLTDEAEKSLVVTIVISFRLPRLIDDDELKCINMDMKLQDELRYKLLKKDIQAEEETLAFVVPHTVEPGIRGVDVVTERYSQGMKNGYTQYLHKKGYRGQALIDKVNDLNFCVKVDFKFPPNSFGKGNKKYKGNLDNKKMVCLLVCGRSAPELSKAKLEISPAFRREFGRNGVLLDVLTKGPL